MLLIKWDNFLRGSNQLAGEINEGYTGRLRKNDGDLLRTAFLIAYSCLCRDRAKITEDPVHS